MAIIIVTKERSASLKPTSAKGDAKSKANIKEFPMNPYRQGAFDGFCGVYAIINALRLIATTSDGLGEEFCDRLFTAIMRHATLKIGIRRLANSGTPQWLMRSFLRGTCAFVGRNRKLKPILDRPLLRKGRLSLNEVLSIMRKPLATQRCAFIVEIGGVYSHWTVIREIGKAQVHLFDSDGIKVLNISEMRMSYEKPNTRANHWLMSGSVIMLTRSQRWP